MEQNIDTTEIEVNIAADGEASNKSIQPNL